MKIQPIDIDSQRQRETVVRDETAKPLLYKSRLKRLFIFDRQFPSVLRNSSSEKPVAGEAQSNKETEFEPSSICLAKMVQSYIEETNEKKKCGRNRCNCFNGNNSNGSSDEEADDAFGDSGDSIIDADDALKSLIHSASIAETKLLAEIAKIVEKNNKVNKTKNDLRNVVTDALSILGYDSSICKSKWDQTQSYPAGEYEYIDVIMEETRLIVDIDFRSEFEMARSTGNYKAVIQSLPYIFVGKTERLSEIVSIVSEAAKRNIKKKGMHFPPWRKTEYMLAKWLSSYTRTKQTGVVLETGSLVKENDDVLVSGEKMVSPAESEADSGEEKLKLEASATFWRPPTAKAKVATVTGLALLLKDKQ